MQGLNSKIENSTAFNSLRAEQRVAEILHENGWETIQSPYYIDIETNKLRETDVIGTLRWEKKRKNDELFAEIRLLIEVKSVRDFHILCSGVTNPQHHVSKNEHWLGYSNDAIAELETALRSRYIDLLDVRSFIHDVEKQMFPNHKMKTSSIRVPPPPVKHCYSAFRETNISTEKELDNSVLWRATQALRSALNSQKKELIDNFLEDLLGEIEFLRRKKAKVIAASCDSIMRYSEHITQFVPVVVIDSRLWSAISDRPVEMERFRLVQLNTYGSADWWVDVVSQNHLEKYIVETGEYYRKAFKRAKAKPWP